MISKIKRFLVNNLQVQFYWSSWGIGHHKVYDDLFRIYNHYLYIGPLQMTWMASETNSRETE